MTSFRSLAPLVASASLAVPASAQLFPEITNDQPVTLTASAPGIPTDRETIPDGPMTFPRFRRASITVVSAASGSLPEVVDAESRFDATSRAYRRSYTILQRASTATAEPGAAADTGIHETVITFRPTIAMLAEIEMSWIGAASSGASNTAQVDVFDDGTIDFDGPAGDLPLTVPLTSEGQEVRIRVRTGARAQGPFQNAAAQLDLEIRPTRAVFPITGCWSENRVLAAVPRLDGSVFMWVDNVVPRDQPVFLVLGFALSPRPLAVPERTGGCLLEPRTDVVIPLGSSVYIPITMPPYINQGPPFDVHLQAVRLDISAGVADISGVTRITY